MQVEIFMEKQPEYRYMKLPSGYADVFIYKYKEEKQNSEDEGDSKEYLYEFNCFRIKQDEITEDMIKENPFNYLDYSTKELSQDEKIESLQKKVNTLEKQLEKMQINK